MTVRELIKFNDLDGNPVEETWYFDLSIAEVTKMDAEFDGDLGEHFNTILKSGDRKALLNAFETIIRWSVGKRSEDGRRLIKTPEVVADFMESKAYDQFFLSLMSSPGKAAAFFNSVIPTEAIKKMAEEAEYTNDQLLEMSDEEFNLVVGTDPTKMKPEHLTIAYQRKNKAA